MKKIPLLDNEIEIQGFEIGDYLFRGTYWKQSSPPEYFENTYIKVIDKKTLGVAEWDEPQGRAYIVYSFHVINENGELNDYWHDADYMVEHIRERSELFRLELTEEEEAKFLLMGL